MNALHPPMVRVTLALVVGATAGLRFGVAAAAFAAAGVVLLALLLPSRRGGGSGTLLLLAFVPAGAWLGAAARADAAADCRTRIADGARVRVAACEKLPRDYAITG